MLVDIDVGTGTLTAVRGDGRVAKATLLRVPGHDGHGAYMGEVDITPPNITDEMPLRDDLTDSIRDIGDALVRHGFDVRPVSLPVRLVYGGAWAPGALENQVGYDPLNDPEADEACRRFFNLIWANLPRQWSLEPKLTPWGLKILFRAPDVLRTEVYGTHTLIRAAADGHLNRLAAMAASLVSRKGNEGDLTAPE